MSTVLAKVRVFPAKLCDVRFVHLDKEGIEQKFPKSNFPNKVNKLLIYNGFKKKN